MEWPGVVILRPYQIVGRDFLAARTKALLADEMRVGKTPQAIAAADKVGARCVLVLCPAIGTEQWVGEWRRWSPDRTVGRFTGFNVPKSDVVVASYAKGTLYQDELLQVKWDLVIADEAHNAKNPLAARTKLVYGRKGVGWGASRLWALSGTPAGRHAGELWPLMRAFGLTELDYPMFLRAYCDVNPITEQVYGTKVSRIPELRAKLAPIMLRRLKKDVAPDLPAVLYEFMHVMPESLIDAEAELDMPDLEDIATQQWMDARLFDGSIAQARIASATRKVRALTREIVEALRSSLYTKTVVFGHHTAPLAKLVHDLGEFGVKAAHIYGGTPSMRRADIQREFMRGDLEVLCANIQTAGTAIDLSVASHGYFLELDWVPANNVQAANRLVSLAKDEPVTFDIVTCKGSVDDRVQKVLMRRVKQLSQLY